MLLALKYITSTILHLFKPLCHLPAPQKKLCTSQSKIIPNPSIANKGRAILIDMAHVATSALCILDTSLNVWSNVPTSTIQKAYKMYGNAMFAL